MLANGLDVHLEHHAERPTVTVAVAYAAGASHDPPGRLGLAHLTEHVTYQGTRDLGEDAMISLLERVGVLEFAGVTTYDHTQYFATAPREAASTLLWIEAQRMALVLAHANEETVSHQLRVVDREWHERVGDHAGSAVNAVLARALFPVGHPYANEIATANGVHTLALADVRSFYREFYRPSRARLALVGDVPLDEAERLVRLLFEGIADDGQALARTTIPLARATADRMIVLRAPVPGTSVRIAWATPAYFEPFDADLDVLASLFCRDESSFLASEIVRRRRVGTRVHCRQQSSALASRFVVDVSIGDESQRAGVVDSLDGVLEAVVAGRIGENQYEAARRDFIGRVARRSRDQRSRARAMANFTISPMASTSRYSPEADVSRYQAVTAGTLREAARFLMNTGRVIIVTVPDVTAPDEGVVVQDLSRALR